MSTSARSHWPVLVEKARQQADRTRQEWGAAQARLASLQASLSRIQVLIAEYQGQNHDNDPQSRSMRERLNTRAFIAQLQSASNQLASEAQKMAAAVDQLRLRLLRDEQEVLKMEKLADNALRAVRLEQHRREQKGYDDMALMRRHWTNDPAT